MIPYAQALAQNGIGAYRFDFRGGNNSRSDGATTKMSPMTEVSDLEAVLKAAKSWEFVDWNHVFLMGNSQGGLVCALTAPRYQNEIQGEILCTLHLWFQIFSTACMLLWRRCRKASGLSG